jgi:hypothetical protein
MRGWRLERSDVDLGTIALVLSGREHHVGVCAILLGVCAMAIGKITQAAELNFNVLWNKMPVDVRLAFIGSPSKVKLPDGFRLYKLTEYQIANREGKITEWWSPTDPYGIDPGLAAKQHFARHFNTSLSDVVRVTSAVKENWNALTHILEAELTRPVYAFWGQCSMMARLDEGKTAKAGIAPTPMRSDMSRVRTKNLPGYGWQLYIPNLTSAHIKESRRTPV